MTSDNILYILFHYNCYMTTYHLDINNDLLKQYFNWYFDLRSKGISYSEIKSNVLNNEKFNIVKFYLNPMDFQDHFKNFNPEDSDAEAYERDLASQALLKSNYIGSWLLRHSSKNRTEGSSVKRYYAVSYLE